VKVNLQELNQFAGRISVSQALIAPPLWPAIKNAYLAEKVAELSTESVRREVLFGVAQAYYGAAALKEALAVRKRVLDNNIAHEKDAVIRVQAGAVQRIIMVRAKMDRATAEQDLLSAQYAYASAKIAIGTLLDRKESFEVSRPEPAPLPPNPVSLEEGILERPDLKAAQGNLELASRAHHTTWLKYLPSVGVSAAYQASNTQGFTGKYDSWAAILGVSWTLWDGGLRESEWRENEAKLVEAKANLRKSEITARDEVRRAQLELESARANLAKSDEQLKLAQENMQLAQVNFEGGAATQLEISDANATLTSAEIGHVAETLNAQLAALKLLKAAGRFNP
jgi:outer membrane protein TolC